MLYLVLKFIHVLSAIVWVGGVIAVTVLNLRVARASASAALGTLIDASGFYGRAVVGPAAGLTLLAGIGTAATGGIPMRSLWIIWGFAAIVLSVALGATLIRVNTQRIGELAAAGNVAQLPSVQRQLAWVNALNILLLLSAVAAMVLKPSL